MPATSMVLDEVLPYLAGRGVCQDAESRMEPLVDPNDGREAGLLIESPFGRLVVTKRDEPVLSLGDVSHVRQMMIRARARRALLYVPLQTTIANPVMLLATLSKIEIVRLAAAKNEILA